MFARKIFATNLRYSVSHSADNRFLERDDFEKSTQREIIKLRREMLTVVRFTIFNNFYTTRYFEYSEKMEENERAAVSR